MPTFHQQLANNQIIISVALAYAADGPRHNFEALLDTGAQMTAISPTVGERLGLVPIGQSGMTVASGQTVPVFQYRARVDIPVQYAQAASQGETDSFLMGKDLLVSGLPYSPEGYDVLLGMDLIGAFHITIYDNRIILSN